MAAKDGASRRAPRRTDTLSRERIVDAATEILDAGGEDALTFRALTTSLSTGYGAIYHRVASKSDLLAAATDAVIAGVVTAPSEGTGPRDGLRLIALGLFDAIDAHPWVGAQLSREPWRPALLDIYESVGGHLRALGVADASIVDSAGVLVNYILGVAGQNAAHARRHAEDGTDRADALAAVAARWAQLDPATHPSLRAAATQLGEHDDREQFRTGVDIILAGIVATNISR